MPLQLLDVAIHIPQPASCRISIPTARARRSAACHRAGAVARRVTAVAIFSTLFLCLRTSAYGHLPISLQRRNYNQPTLSSSCSIVVEIEWVGKEAR